MQELYPRLFGGGHAYLELTGEDLLDTGVAIMARPPGKRVSNISLLSGGEKAMTAVALVFAIFRLNPAPFCLLDEVDAPLDEANVGRFTAMVSRDERAGAVPVRHPQQGDHGGGAAAQRRYHARAGRQPPGVRRPRRSRAPRRRCLTQEKSTMSDVWLLRLGILIAGVILVAAIYFFGRPRKPGQGRRLKPEERGGRTEPTLGAQIENELAAAPDFGSDSVVQSEMELLDRTVGSTAATAASELGKRADEDFDKIVTLYIAAKAGQKLHGPDIVVAAEKAGLTYGHMNVFHRLVEGHPERGPVFSVANIMKPGSFDMADDPVAGNPGDRLLPDPAGADQRARRLGNDAADRAAHGRTARRRGAGRTAQCPRPPAHRPHPRGTAHLRPPARSAADHAQPALVAGDCRSGFSRELFQTAWASARG